MGEHAVELLRAPPPAQPIVFGPPDRSLVGIYHPPADPAGRPAVVLCYPLGYEAMGAHRSYRHLAERLAARGFPALRFDHDGTGDSAGRSTDEGRIRAWIESVKAALVTARERTAGGPVALFGVHFGATLAVLAAAEDGDVDAIVAWAPVLSGRVYAREIRAFRMIKDPRAPIAPRSDGGEEVGGYFYSAETLGDMARLDLLTTPLPARRALVLRRGERSSDEARLAEHLSAIGVEVRAAVGAGYAGMMRDDPYESVVPEDDLDRVVDWLAEAPPRERAAVRSGDARHRTTFAVTGRSADRPSIETPLFFGEEPRLFGIVTEPAETRPGRPALIFLNVGANHHVGPHRMNVELARALAGLGYVTFRLDAAGLGESLAPPGVRENRIYTKDSIADVQRAMTLLAERGVRRFVLVGLCSGAYLAYHTTIADPRVVGQVILSPFAFEWQEGDPVTPTMRKPARSTRFYARAVLDRGVWRRAARGEVNVRLIAGAILERLRARVEAGLPAWSARLRGHLLPKNDVERAFGEMSDRGVESLMVLSFDDGGVDTVAEYLGHDAERMRGRENFEFKIIEGGDHTFKTLASQATLSTIVTDYLVQRFP